MSRQREIVDVLLRDGFQGVNELAARFDVTTSTIRRDLERLERRQLLRRTHGGAVPVHPPESRRKGGAPLHGAEKVAIGKAMAERILEGQTIILDGGTTTLEVARHLDHQRLTVVTNDLRIAAEVATRPPIHLAFLGGELLPNTFRMWGPTTEQQLSRFRVDVAIFSADTVAEDGLYSAGSYEIEQKRLMRAIAKEAFFVADSSKFGREALFKLLDIGDFTAGITDGHLDPLRASDFAIPIIQASGEG
ncbi:DeoR/GlpR family DNA-binding transcription regulator [Microbacterium karelineae]|uniref:DeoR/GlpR family DNA-binding transcription regulator n=1 Tax=Microbacterium karelineae TaxID=2654283 RepID=UPI0012EA947B|nr:DeoR/GlpR family DNA-binding transcription regulator [Microbacterium karelineae]